MLSKTCSLFGTANVREQISEHVFKLNGGYCGKTSHMAENCLVLSWSILINKKTNGTFHLFESLVSMQCIAWCFCLVLVQVSQDRAQLFLLKKRQQQQQQQTTKAKYNHIGAISRFKKTVFSNPYLTFLLLLFYLVVLFHFGPFSVSICFVFLSSLGVIFRL